MIEDVLGIIERCVRGEERAWDIFVKEFGSMAQNILRHRFSSLGQDSREDIIQNVFIKLIKGGMSHFNGKSKFEFFKYFKTTVMNEGFTYVRRPKPDEITGPPDPEDPDRPTVIDPPDTRTVGPEVIAEVKECLKIINEFPLLDQETFLMKVKGYKDEEVAERLNIPMGTVASKYSRIREKIRGRLEEN
jgi:RNA polymerase sigma factor (sigma-70 family)